MDVQENANPTAIAAVARSAEEKLDPATFTYPRLRAPTELLTMTLTEHSNQYIAIYQNNSNVEVRQNKLIEFIGRYRIYGITKITGKDIAKPYRIVLLYPHLLIIVS